MRPNHADGVQQRTSGLHSVLSLAPAYRLFQRGVGAGRSRDRIAAEVLCLGPTDRVLDLGCGTADILDHISVSDYLGFDPSDRYVDDARRRFGQRARFTTQLNEVSRLDDRTLAMAIGVLHHTSEESALELLEVAARSLGPGGRFVSIDPTIVEGQSRVARAVALRDRGRHVRSPEETEKLVRRAFASVEVTVRHDLLRIPYSHAIVVARL
ncbi:MAG: class I SAM-dependent methyltransferase [Ilumatobacteraceae bacterium]